MSNSHFLFYAPKSIFNQIQLYAGPFNKFYAPKSIFNQIQLYAGPFNN